MAALSIALVHGEEGTIQSEFLVGTAAPTGGQDVELRFNDTDTNGNKISRRDVYLALEAFQRALVSDSFIFGAIVPE